MSMKLQTKDSLQAKSPVSQDLFATFPAGFVAPIIQSSYLLPLQFFLSFRMVVYSVISVALRPKNASVRPRVGWACPPSVLYTI